MLTASLHTCVISGLLLNLVACQSKPKSALNRPFVSGLVDPDTNARDLADIKQEHRLDEVRWKHLRNYTQFASANRELFPTTGITYGQASQRAERYFFSQQAQDSLARVLKENGIDLKDMPDAPPLDASPPVIRYTH
jgi:hypothetical protein